MRKISTKCSQCRRVKVKLLLKGEKCLTAKCPFMKRGYPPGQHGPDQKHGKISGFGQQLQEKQKAKKIYGILEKQFASYIEESTSKTGDSGKILLGFLESRLDNVVFRMGLSKARSTARQLVRHGLIAVNDRKVDIPSFRVKVGDVITLSKKGQTKKYFEKVEEKLAKIEAPSWLGLEPKEAKAKVLNSPIVEDPNFDTKAIIEFYSR